MSCPYLALLFKYCSGGLRETEEFSRLNKTLAWKVEIKLWAEFLCGNVLDEEQSMVGPAEQIDVDEDIVSIDEVQLGSLNHELPDRVW